MKVNTNLLAIELELDEGYRRKVYRDTKGILTVGIGRNLEDRGVSVEEARYLAANDIKEAYEYLSRRHPVFNSLSDNRKRILVNMAFQLGTVGVTKFRKMWKAIEKGDFVEASVEMLDSKWYKQDTPKRARRLANRMRFDRNDHRIGVIV